MKLKLLHEQVEIVPYDEDHHRIDLGYDPYIAADQADMVANKSGIRIDRTKELSWIALNGDDVVGGLWSSLENDPDQDALVYSWDVAVHLDHRGARVGLELINAAMDDYRSHSRMYDRVYMRVYAVNPKLVRVLERKYGFDVESVYPNGSAHLTYYG